MKTWPCADFSVIRDLLRILSWCKPVSQGLNRYSQLLSAPVPDVPNPTSLKRLADRFNAPLRDNRPEAEHQPGKAALGLSIL